MRLRPTSVQARVTFAATLIVALALVACASALYVVLRGNLLLSARQGAKEQAKAVAVQLATPALSVRSTAPELAHFGVSEVGPGPIPRRTAGSPLVEIFIADPGHTVPGHTVPGHTVPAVPSHVAAGLAALSRPPATASKTAAPAAAPGFPLTPARTASPMVGVAGKYAFATESVPLATGKVKVVTAGVSLRPAESALHTVMWMLVPGVPLLLLLVAAVTWCAAGRALRPVAAIRTEVADITASDLHRRVPVPRARDEIGQLATTMNTTLDRLERASDRQRRFVADASHELRSPLATLRTRLELAQLDPASWPDVTAMALADTERLHRLADDLLLLARLDADEPGRDDQVDLGQVAAEEVARRRPRPGVRIDLDLRPDVVVSGSRAHLARMLTNLLDNAERHAESTVTVRTAAAGDHHVTLEVTDDGAGIPEADRERIFDRFTRLDESRSRDEGGAGLGLAIARDITLRHHGTLTAAGTARGARLVARLPAARTGSEPPDLGVISAAGATEFTPELRTGRSGGRWRTRQGG